MALSDFIKYGIKIPTGATGDVKVICPNCTPHNRKPAHRNNKDLSVNVDEGVWLCHNCQWAGTVKSRVFTRPEPIPESKLNLTDAALKWFEGRGISKNTLQRFKVHSDRAWFPQTGKEGSCIVFPYYRGETLVNAKYRDGSKNFKMIKDAELVFFNLSALEGAKEVVTTEGELDCLAAYEDGYFNVLSVPNGASKGNNKLEYLDNCWKEFEHIETIILATDNDEAGLSLRNELARRFGRHRCKYVVYPEGCKDLNECLIKGFSPKEIINNAVPFPIEGVLKVMDFEDTLNGIYKNGVDAGLDTGFMDFDSHLRQRKGEFTIVTGIPGSGKSRFIDQIANRMASKHLWKIAFCSPEKQPSAIHVGYLMSQFTGQNFFAKDPRYKICPEDFETAKHYIQDHFYFYQFSDVDQSVQGVVDKAIELVKSQGIDMLVIDPWNYLEHQCPPGMSETQYTSKALDIVIKFAKMYDVCVYLVAHPTKIRKVEGTGKYEVPTLYSISGSSHWFNKCDNGFCVYRDYETGEVTIYIQKIRNDFVGKVGQVSFKYQPFVGAYAETDFIPDYRYYIKSLGGEF